MPTELPPSGLSKYGWIPDLPDIRDHLFKSIAPEARPLPSKVDLRPLCGPIVNQASLGSCVGNAIASAHLFNQMKQRRISRNTLPPSFYPSRLFVYYNARAAEGTIEVDAGTTIRTGVKSVDKQGVCPESMWPYFPHLFKSRPYSAAFDRAIFHQAISYERLDTLQQCKRCLADGLPFVFGFSVYDSFESNTVTQTGMMSIPQTTERLLGGHAVMAVGYDDATGYFTVMNSWGKYWGDKGYFYMPYAIIINPNLSADFWVIRKVES